METVDPATAIGLSAARQKQIREDAVEVFEWFRDRYDETDDSLVLRRDALPAIARDLDWETDAGEPDAGRANRALAQLLTDKPDPVVQLVHPDGRRFVGIVDFEVWEDAGAYGFHHLPDGSDSAKPAVVCGRCVEVCDDHQDVTMAVAGEGRFDADAGYETLRDAITSHIVSAHDRPPEDVTPAANLAAPTNIGGNEAFHKGNDGSGSGLNADKLDGSDKNEIGGSVTLPVRGANGSINTQTSYTFASPTYGLVIRSNDFISTDNWPGGTRLRTPMGTETAGDFTFSASIKAAGPATTTSIEFFMEKAGVRFFTYKNTLTPNQTIGTTRSITTTGVGLNETLRGGFSASADFNSVSFDGPYNIYQGRFKRTPTGTGSPYTGFFGVSANFRSPTYVNYSVGGKTTGGSPMTGLPSTTLTTGSISYFSVSWTITDVTNYGPKQGRFTNNVVNLVPQTATYS